MSREIVFALKVGPAGSTASELRAFGQSVVSEQERISRQSANVKSKIERDAARQAEQERKNYERAILRDLDNQTREAKRQWREMNRANAEASRERLATLKKEAASRKEIEREAATNKANSEAEQRDAMRERQSQIVLATKAEAEMHTRREQAAVKFKTVFNDGAEAITGVVRGFALLGVTSEETTEKMLKQFAKVEGVIQILRAGVKGSFAIGEGIGAFRNSRGGGGGSIIDKVGEKGAEVAGGAAAKLLSGGGGAAAGAGGAIGGVTIAAWAAAIGGAVAGLTIFGEAITGAAKRADSWTQYIAKGEASLGVWIDNATGFFTWLNSGSIRKGIVAGLGGPLGMLASGGAADIAQASATGKMVERSQRANAAATAQRERAEQFGTIVAQSTTELQRLQDDRNQQSLELRANVRGRRFGAGATPRSADSFLLGLEQQRLGAVGGFMGGSELANEQARLAAARSGVSQARFNRDRGGASELEIRGDINANALLQNSRDRATGMMGLKGGTEATRNQAALRLVELEQKRVALVREAADIEHETANEKLKASDEVLDRLNQAISLTRQQREAATERLQGAQERFGMMETGEQRRAVMIKKKLDEAERLEKAGNSSGAARIRNGLTPDELGVVQGIGTRDAQNAAGKEARRRAEAAGFSSSFGAGERAEIQTAQRTEAQLQQRVAVERTYQVEIKRDDDAIATRLAKQINDELDVRDARVYSKIMAVVKARNATVVREDTAWAAAANTARR